MGSLTTLKLEGNKLGDEGAKALGAAHFIWILADSPIPIAH